MAGFIKKYYPNCTIIFLGRTYTKPIIELSEHVDEFINYDDLEPLPQKEKISRFKNINADTIIHVFPKKEVARLAKQAKIPLRVGTTNRVFHWLTCNHLIKLSRKNSNLHEAQLNLNLLRFLNCNTTVALNDICNYYGFSNIPILDSEFLALVDNTKFNLILHPKSRGSAPEWGIDNFEKLIALLPKDKFKIFITGTEQEAKLMSDFLKNKAIVDLTGKLSLQQLIAFINAADGLIAASTGPLHIAAALNRKAIGLFVPKRPMYPKRWMPLGKNSLALVFDENCIACKNEKKCNCIRKINPKRIADLLEQTNKLAPKSPIL